MSTSPHELCLENFKYDPDTGVLSHAEQNWLFTSTKEGRITVNYFGKYVPATHVIWYYMTGRFPIRKMTIDHMDRNPTNNKWHNLREISRSDNCRNTKTGWNRNKFVSSVNFNGVSFELGWYNTKEQATAVTEAAYLKVKQGTFSPLIYV